MNDKQFLQWIHDRLQYVVGENPNVDYMLKLRAIIAATPPEQFSPNYIVPGPTTPPDTEAVAYVDPVQLKFLRTEGQCTVYANSERGLPLGFITKDTDAGPYEKIADEEFIKELMAGEWELWDGKSAGPLYKHFGKVWTKIKQQKG